MQPEDNNNNNKRMKNGQDYMNYRRPSRETSCALGEFQEEERGKGAKRLL